VASLTKGNSLLKSRWEGHEKELLLGGTANKLAYAKPNTGKRLLSGDCWPDPKTGKTKLTAAIRVMTSERALRKFMGQS